MSGLLSILGKSVTSKEVATELNRYPSLRRVTEDLSPEPSVHYLRSEEDGVLIKLSDEGEVVTIFLMSEGKDGFSQFPGPLPGNLTFTSRASDALKTFGAPGHSRPPGRMGSFEHGELLRFDWPDHSVHFLFRKGGGIDLVTAMVARSVPGRSRPQPA